MHKSVTFLVLLIFFYRHCLTVKQCRKSVSRLGFDLKAVAFQTIPLSFPLDCSDLCNLTLSCQSFVFDAMNGMCKLFNISHFYSESLLVEKDMSVYMEEIYHPCSHSPYKCQNGGKCYRKQTQNQDEARCECQNGFKGENCEEVCLRTLYNSIGCYKDSSTRAIPPIEGTHPFLTDRYGRRSDPVNKCAVTALLKEYKVFAVQSGGWCASSATAENTYNKYGPSTGCQGGEGGAMTNSVYNLTGTLRNVGCFKDSATDRAIPTLEGKDPVLDGNYQTRTYALEKCAYAALRQKFQTFALQNGGWCVSGTMATMTYNKFGSSSSCAADGKGGLDANQVYSLVYHDNECD